MGDIVTFEQFYKNFDDSKRYNLYIVWRGKQALYVGISNDNVWNRWFSGVRSHVSIGYGGVWMGDYSSPIGKAIIYNRPASMRWKVELRYIPHEGRQHNLEQAERELIRELRPLFNGMHRAKMTDKELALYHKLTAHETDMMMAAFDKMDEWLSP